MGRACAEDQRAEVRVDRDENAFLLAPRVVKELHRRGRARARTLPLRHDLHRAATLRDDDRRSDRPGISRPRKSNCVQGIVCDYRMCVSDARTDIVGFQTRTVVNESLRTFTLSEKAQDEFDGDPHLPNRRLTSENLGVYGNAPQELWVRHPLLRLARHRIAPRRPGGRRAHQGQADFLLHNPARRREAPPIWRGGANTFSWTSLSAARQTAI